MNLVSRNVIYTRRHMSIKRYMLAAMEKNLEQATHFIFLGRKCEFSFKLRYKGKVG